MQQVGCRMVERSGLAHGRIHSRLDIRTYVQRAAVDDAVMQECAAGLAGIADIETQALCRQIATVTNLAAGLCIERRLIEHHDAFLASAQAVDHHAFLEQRKHLTGTGCALVTEEARFAFHFYQAVVVHAEGTGRTRTLTLRLHFTRSEERRVGKECVSTCRSRWSPYQ